MRWFYIVCLFYGTAISAQQFPNIQFNYLTEKEGLSDNEIGSIVQDRAGFIWIGTGDGLDRFDGYRVKHFFHNPSNENSLVNNAVYRIAPDEKDRLWITTREGISVYDKDNGQFHNFRHNPADKSSIDNDQYATVYAGAGNGAFICTTSSVYSFDSLFHYKKLSPGIKGLTNVENAAIESYGHLTIDKKGQLWASGSSYLFLIDKSTMRVSKKFGPFEGNIESIYQDSNLQYWIGSFGGGLLHFDPQTGTASKVQLDTASFAIVHSITEWKDRYQTRWLVLGGDNGLVLVDPVSLKNKQYTFHAGYFPRQILTKNVVQQVYVDRQNILWIATEAGVCYVMPSRQLFDLWNIAGSSGKLAPAVSDWIYSLCDARNGYWMTRWVGPGIYNFDKEGELQQTITAVRLGNRLVSLSDSLKPYYIRNEGENILWFTTNKYLVHYDLRSNEAVLYKPPDAYPMTGLRTILVVDDRSWWIRTRNNGNNGIYVFDPAARKFTRHFNNSAGCDGCVPRDLLTILLSSKKELYVAAVGKGLLKYDAGTDRFIPFFRFQGTDVEQHSNSFESIAEDEHGVLWIASYKGLFALDPVSKKIVHDYTADQRAGAVEVSGVVFDENQNAWLTSSRGIFYVLHSTGEMRELSNTEGLRNNSNGVFQKGKDFSIYNGIQGYLVRIHPSEILQRRVQQVPVHFSDATVVDSPYFFQLTSSGQKQIIVAPGRNRFSVDFSVMNYDGDNQYYYRLDGLMNDWQQNENGHLVFYNLSPGKYLLHVKGGIKSGELLTTEDKLTIVVRPFWWQTTWFKICCAAIVILLTITMVRRRIVHIRQEASFKQKIAETEMMALRSQMNPHFIFNSLNSIENFMMQNEKRLASSYLNKFARLIRSILESSRNELIPVSKDMEALRLYVDLEQLRFNHKFGFNLHVDPQLLNGDYRVPALLIQPYVENAIVHGLAHSEREDLNLTVTAFLKNEYIYYTIEDNGIGRKLSSQYNQQNRPRHKSVGLAITEERIRIFNRRQNAHGRVTITDLFDEQNQPSGTKVDIMIRAV